MAKQKELMRNCIIEAAIGLAYWWNSVQKMADNKQTAVENYDTRGTSCNCDSIYLSKLYF